MEIRQCILCFAVTLPSALCAALRGLHAGMGLSETGRSASPRPGWEPGKGAEDGQFNAVDGRRCPCMCGGHASPEAVRGNLSYDPPVHPAGRLLGPAQRGVCRHAGVGNYASHCETCVNCTKAKIARRARNCQSTKTDVRSDGFVEYDGVSARRAGASAWIRGRAYCPLRSVV